VLHAAHWKYRTQKIAICAPSHNFVRLYLRIRQSEKNLLNSSNSCACPHSMVNFSPLTAEICWRVWGTPANFNGFHVLASLLQRRRSPETNQTLHDVWPSAGLVHCIFILGGSCPLMEFCPVQNSLCIQVLHSPTLAALLHGTAAEGVSQTAAWYKEWNYETFAEGATYIRQGGHHVGHRPTF